MIIDGFNICIQRSKKRKKTINAKLTGKNTVRVLAPGTAGERLIMDFVKRSVKKFSDQKIILTNIEKLKKRAEMLRDKYVPNAPDFTISYSKRLKTTWGKCMIKERALYLNPKLSEYPLWVVDMVIIHEITHLIYPDHGKDFRSVVSRYRLKERALGFLLAKGMRYF